MSSRLSHMPKTIVVHHRSGIGDLIWHIPYLRAIAAQSQNGKISLIAKPSCLARQVLAAEECVEDIFEFDYRPRKSENRKGKQDSLKAQLAFAAQLREYGFERMVNFSPRSRYNLLAVFAGISCRIGFGFSWFERCTLNCPPYIEPYQGNGNWVYPEATALAKAHGFVTEAILPRMAVSQDVLDEISYNLPQSDLGLVAFSIGTSEEKKQWGAERFAQLAIELIKNGFSVVLLGGRAESVLAKQIRTQVAKQVDASHLLESTQGTIQTTGAYLTLAKICVGNDTGVLNMALACETPALGLFGASKVPELNDPLMHVILEDGMANIVPGAVFEQLTSII